MSAYGWIIFLVVAAALGLALRIGDFRDHLDSRIDRLEAACIAQSETRP